jgi:hypothetical protein
MRSFRFSFVTAKKIGKPFCRRLRRARPEAQPVPKRISAAMEFSCAQLLKADVRVRCAGFSIAAFFAAKNENRFRFRREMQLGGLRNALAQNDAFFDFAAHGVDRQICETGNNAPRWFCLRASIRAECVPANDLRAVLQSFVAGEKNHPPRFFRVAFKHKK